MNFHKFRLEKLKKFYYPRTILDLGAHEGRWAEIAKEVFPNSTIHMVEGNPDKYDILKKINIPFTISLIGDKDNIEVDYYKAKHSNDTGNSIYKEISSYFQDNNSEVVKLPMKTLDTLVLEKNIHNVDFIKLDVQGSEMNVLKGAKSLLKTVSYVLLETQLMEYNKNSPKFTQLFKYLNKNSFTLCDMFEIHYSKDGFTREIDFLFVKDHDQMYQNDDLWNTTTQEQLLL